MNNIDQQLSQVYHQHPVLSDSVQEQVLSDIRTRRIPKRQLHRVAFIVALYILAFIAFSVTAYAIYRYLSPLEVATELGTDDLISAFESEDSILINEQIEDDDYIVTLLGYLPSATLEEYSYINQRSLEKNKTYIVIAIERKDGNPIDYGLNSFYATPVVHGINPVFFNMNHMNGSYTSFERDNISYRLLSMDTIQLFAKRDLQLAVMSGMLYNQNCFDYNEETGTIHPNPSYKGLNVIFDLPIDHALGNEILAEQYLRDNSSIPTIPEDSETQRSIPEEEISEDSPQKQDTNKIPSIDISDYSYLDPEELSYITWQLKHPYPSDNVPSDPIEFHLSDDDTQLQVIDSSTGITLKDMHLPDNQIIARISSDIDRTWQICYTLAIVYTGNTPIYNSDSHSYESHLNPVAEGVELRFYDYNLDVTETIDLDELYTVIDGKIQIDDLMKKLDLSYWASMNGQYVYMTSPLGYYVYDRKTQEAREILMDLSLLEDERFSFRPLDEKTIQIYRLDLVNVKRVPIGTIDMDTMEATFLDSYLQSK